MGQSKVMNSSFRRNGSVAQRITTASLVETVADDNGHIIGAHHVRDDTDRTVATKKQKRSVCCCRPGIGLSRN